MTITSNDSLWTSVTSHHAQAHPPTTVFLLVDPQQPPERNSLEKSWCINLQIIRKWWTDNHEMCIGQWRIHIAQGATRGQKIIINLFYCQGFCRKMKYAGCSCIVKIGWKESSLLINGKESCPMHMASRMPGTMLPVTDYSFQDSREYWTSTLSCLNKSWPIPQKYVYLVVFDP